MKHAFQKRAVFTGCARDCAAALPRVLANVTRMAGLFAEAAFVFIENDSRDATKSQLEAWCGERPNARLISLDGLAASCPVRTIRLATARNRYLSAVRSEFSDYNLLIALDEVNAAEIDLAAVHRAVEFREQDASHAAIFANSEDVYYDMWALRHPDRCPGDVWEEVCDYALTRRAPDQKAFVETFAKRIFALPRNAPPFEVASAFRACLLPCRVSRSRQAAFHFARARQFLCRRLDLPSGRLAIDAVRPCARRQPAVRSARPRDLGQDHTQRGLPLRLGKALQALPRRLRVRRRNARATSRSRRVPQRCRQ